MEPLRGKGVPAYLHAPLFFPLNNGILPHEILRSLVRLAPLTMRHTECLTPSSPPGKGTAKDSQEEHVAVLSHREAVVQPRRTGEVRQTKALYSILYSLIQYGMVKWHADSPCSYRALTRLRTLAVSG